ncbi:1,3-beta-galactosyl-N-acetylhexosamine phosphorylase [Lacticaseibacillus saniviri]
MRKGQVTIPSDQDFFDATKTLIDKWGADAIRDSDGTKLDPELKTLSMKFYSTYFVARGHNEFAASHPAAVQQLYLMSERVVAYTPTLTIGLMAGYYDQQIQPNWRDNPKTYWEVIDRTTGMVVKPADWTVDEASQSVQLSAAIPFHEYTVSFLADMLWDPTEMYNHLTNNWGDKPHDIPFDVRDPAARDFIQSYLKQWLKANPEIDVVRFTTFFYHFTLVFDQHAREKFVDWLGYGGTVSVAALKAFEQIKGYRLRPEDFVDAGFYNSTFRPPTQRYLDYIDFVQRFVTDQAKILVAMVHSADKEAMMFLGDNWIGAEPYGPYFKEIGLDAVVGSVGSGMTLRLIADIPGVKYTEGRFLPYFFPDVFRPGNDPVVEARANWLTARRALMRKPLDRIGYGGYLKLAAQFPDFVDYVAHVTDEFRDISDKIADTIPYSSLKVAVLNGWGKLRSWQSFIVAHGKRYEQTYSYEGVLEALAGQPVDVMFLSFNDILATGIPADVDVMINVGSVGTAFSGGDIWQEPRLVTLIRQWVAAGHGFIGIGEPTATAQPYQGRRFQLADVLGVDQELAFSLSTDRYWDQPMGDNIAWITKDLTLDFGTGTPNLIAVANAQYLRYGREQLRMTVKDYGTGRGAYIAGLPYTLDNARLLLRAMHYAAHKESILMQNYATNPNVEVHVYPGKSLYAILNNTHDTQNSELFLNGKHTVVELEPDEIRWEREPQ